MSYPGPATRGRRQETAAYNTKAWIIGIKSRHAEGKYVSPREKKVARLK